MIEQAIWKTTPMRRRSPVSSSFEIGATSSPKREIRPRVGFTDMRIGARRRLAGAGRAGEELEGIRLDGEGQVAQDLGPHAVAHAHILEVHDRRRAFIVVIVLVIESFHAYSSRP